MNKVCFMACQPVDQDWATERFYVVAFPELTIYGHTIDRFTKEHYREDWPQVTSGRLHGMEWGCWHSVACPDGEIGSQPLEICAAIPAPIFGKARDDGWPEADFITTPDPIARIFGDDGSGRLTELWNSQEGDL